MRKHLSGFVPVLFMATALAVATSAQTQTPRPAPTYESNIQGIWKALHNKLLTMAKDPLLPEDKFGWRPHPDSRSMIEEFRHVTIGLEMSTSQLLKTPFDYAARLKADDAKPKTRTSVVADMEAAITASYDAVDHHLGPSIIMWLDHQGEHYGKLVSNYRVLGIVPPISRKAGRPD